MCYVIEKLGIIMIYEYYFINVDKNIIYNYIKCMNIIKK